MNILYLIESRKNTIGGGVRATQNLVCELRRRGLVDRIGIFGPKLGISSCISNNANIYYFTNDGLKAFTPNFVLTLRKTIKKFQPDIVHAMGLYTGLLSSLIKDFFSYNFKLVVTVHRTGRLRLYPVSKFATKWLSYRIDYATFLTEYQKFHYFQDIDFTPKHYSIIPNVIEKKAINIQQVSVLRSNLLERTKSEYIISYVGRLIKSKQIDMFIKSVAMVREKGIRAGGIIVGSGPDKYLAELKSLVKYLNATKFIDFAGFSNMPELYIASSDCILFPTHHMEALPNLLVESFMLGKPVVISSIPQILPLVKPDINAIVVGTHSPDSYSSAVIKILTDKALYSKISSRAFSTYLETYKPEKVAIDYFNLYKNLLR